MRFLFLKLPSLITRTLFYLAVFLSPVLGVWLASSLVAYINGPKLLTVFSGILLSTLIVDYPEGIRLGISGRDIQAETLSGKSLLSPAPNRQREPGSQSSPHGPRHGSGKDNVNT